MADREYLLDWIIKPDRAVSGARSIAAELLKLEAICDRVGPKLQAIGTGNRGLGSMNKGLGALVPRLAAVEAGAAGAQAKLATLGAGVSTRANAAAGSAKGLGVSLGGVATAAVGLGAVKNVVGSIGDAFREARDYAKETAAESLQLRDRLRELANLRGKPGADDQVVEGHLALRVEAGMTAAEAEAFQNKFEGSLPLADERGKKGITAAVADPMSRKIAALAVRTGIDGGTSGDLAGSMGMFGKIANANVGLGRAQQVVDTLNDGRGSLDLLVKEVMKGAAATVGAGNSFGTIQERAAAISTATGMGQPGQSSTRIEQAIAGLGGFDKKQGKTLAKYGIKGTDDFLSRVDKIAPLVEGAAANGQTPDDAMAAAGFRNRTERKAIAGFVANRDVLRKRIAAVREDPGGGDAKAEAAGRRSEGLNAQFLGSDKAAANRVAEAELAKARDERGRRDQNLLVQRTAAEARLTKRNEIDTPASNAADKARGLFGLKSGLLGGQTGREERIDDEVRRAAGERVPGWLGQLFDPRGAAAGAGGGAAGGGPEGAARVAADRLAARRAAAVPANPAGGPPGAPAGGGANGPAGAAGGGAIVAELRKVGEKIDKQTGELVRAARDNGGGGGLPAGPPGAPPAGGGGFDAGRR